jgi:DNA-3-methyladenine glycosylase I
VSYHDHEWGVPVHGDTTLFEFLILEGAQAGLRWSTIPNKRNGYREAYEGFDPAVVAAFDSPRRASLRTNPTIVYAFMQAVGMVSDRLLESFRCDEARKM